MRINEQSEGSMGKDTPRGSAIVSILKSDSVVDLGKEYLEIGLDAALESGALKDIPLVSSVVGICSAIGSVRDQLLAAKLLRFINQLSEIPQDERTEMVDRLNGEDKFSGRVGAALIEILDRMESEKKPELSAKVFAAFARNEISYDEFRRILLALERVPSFDIEKLEKFEKTTIEESLEFEESVLLAFTNAGLAANNGGFDGGAILPTGLCRAFVKSCFPKA